jgi:hypothetical protein
VLYFPRLGFAVPLPSARCCAPMCAPKARNISLNADGSIKGGRRQRRGAGAGGGHGGALSPAGAALIDGLLPEYRPGAHGAHQLSPSQVETRKQSGVPTTSACMWMPSLAAQLWRAHPARVHQRQPGGPAARVARGRAVQAVARRFCRAPSPIAWQAKR